MSASQKTVGDFIQLHQRHALTHVVRTAVELGILKSLSTGQKTVEQLAEMLQLQSGPLERLLRVLVQTELVEHYGEDYALSTMARLIPDSYLDFGDRYWPNLADHIKTGQSIENELKSTSPSPTTSHSEEGYLQQKSSEEWLLTPVAMDAVQVLDIGRSRRGLRVLEIGASSAVFSATLAHRDPDSVINLVDTRQGLERAQRTIAGIGLERQSELIEVNSLSDIASAPGLRNQTFDLVLLAGLIHRLSTVDCRNLITQLTTLVAAERELVIIDIFPGQEKGDCARAIFELELALRTTTGQLHPPQELKELLQRVGFENLQYAHLPSAPHYWGLLVSQKTGLRER